MKVLLLAPAKNPLIRRLKVRLLDRGCEVSLVSFDEGADYRLRGGGRFSDYLRFWLIRDIIEKESPDLIHAHGVNHYGLLASFQWSVPIVLAAWGSDVLGVAKRSNPFARIVLRLINAWSILRATKVHSSAQHVVEEARRQSVFANKEKFCSFYWGLPPVCDVSNGPGDVDPNAFLSGYSLKPDDRVVLFPRGLRALYSPLLVLDLIRKWNVVNPDRVCVVLKAFSTTSEEEFFFSNARDTRFVYIDRLLNDSELCCLYNRTDIHVNVPISDALGGGVVEPIQFGSVPVLSDLKSYRELLAATEGVMIEGQSDEDLELAVTRAEGLAKHRDKHRAGNYSAIRVVSRIIKLYDEAMGRRSV